MSKRILVTGANSGLGTEIIEQCIGQDLDAYGVCRETYGDITKAKTRENILKLVIDEEINIFINNAAIYTKKDFLLFNDEEIENTLYTNLIAPIILTRQVIEYYINNSGGRIYNINSLAGIQATAKESIYCASKFGLKGFSDCLREEFREYKNIEIINVTLGAFQSKLTRDRENYDELPRVEEVASCIVDHIRADYQKIKTDLVITRK